MEKVYIYIHVAALNNWVEVLNDILKKIEKGGLYDFANEIKICYLGNEDNLDKLKDIINSKEKIVIRKTSTDLSLYERITLNVLHEDSCNEDFYVLYLHTKGITRNNNMNVIDWINYLHYFSIEKYKDCIESLKKYDAVGCNIMQKPKLHFNGNIWWSKSNYIRNLPYNIGKEYLDPEMWILQGLGIFISLFTSNWDHYCLLYPKEKYENIPFMNIEFNNKIETVEKVVDEYFIRMDNVSFDSFSYKRIKNTSIEELKKYALKDIYCLGFTFDGNEGLMKFYINRDNIIKGDKTLYIHKERIESIKKIKKDCKIPKIIHFIWFSGGRPFNIVNYIAIKAAMFHNPDYKIILHCTEEPNNIYYDYVKKDISINIIEEPSYINNNKVYAFQHKADYVRLNILKNMGGIYLDTDFILTKSLDIFLNNNFVMGKERPNSEDFLCNCVIMSEPNSEIVNEWLHIYENSWGEDFIANWMGHSVMIPAQLRKKHEMKVCDNYYFYPFLWDNLSILYDEDNLENYENSYGIHLWDTEASKTNLLPLDLNYFRNKNNAFVRLFKKHVKDLLSEDEQDPNNTEFLIIMKENPHLNLPFPVHENIENNEHVLLKFICDFYDKLPNHIIYVQNAENIPKYPKKIDFLSLENYYIEKINTNKISKSNWWNYCMKNIFGDFYDLGDFTNGKLKCSQFIVSKERILSLNLEFYLNMYNWILENSKENINNYLEDWGWMLIFSVWKKNEKLPYFLPDKRKIVVVYGYKNYNIDVTNKFLEVFLKYNRFPFIKFNEIFGDVVINSVKSLQIFIGDKLHLKIDESYTISF
jgi:mannosyltransferase OCH1-like enzyme